MCVSRCVPVLCSREELLTEIMILSLQLLQEFLFLGESFFCECEEKKTHIKCAKHIKSDDFCALYIKDGYGSET